MFGIEGDESVLSHNLRKSREVFSKKSKNGVRSSIAGKFFMNKDSESQKSVFNSNCNKQGGSLAMNSDFNNAPSSEYFATNNKPKLDIRSEGGTQVHSDQVLKNMLVKQTPEVVNNQM